MNNKIKQLMDPKPSFIQKSIYLLGILILHREIKSAIKQYWVDFKVEHPEEKVPE